MSKKIPAKFLDLKPLAEVPRSAYSDAPGCADPLSEKGRASFFKLLRSKKSKAAKIPDNYKRNVKLNAAAWLRILNPQDNQIAFVLSYQDATGTFAIIVEEGVAREDVMFASDVFIELTGEVSYIRACCTGLKPDQQVLVDELYVQKVQDAIPASKTG